MRCITRPLLSWFLTTTDINGLWGDGSMHVLSTEQASRVLLSGSGNALHSSAASSAADAASFACGPRRWTHLLDVGAGDGNVTSQLAPLVEHVTATEVSAFMIRRLQARGFRAIATDTLDCAAIDEAASFAPCRQSAPPPSSASTLARNAAASTPISISSFSRSSCAALAPATSVDHASGTFDLIACLNVLDRCTLPLTLMRQLHRRLDDSPHARLLMAVVLPFRPTPQKEVVPVGGSTVC